MKCMPQQKNNLILWVVSTEQFVQKVFRKAAIVRDNDARIIPHIPLGAKKRKDAIERQLKAQRERDKDLKYCVRPGKEDLLVLLKYKTTNTSIPNPYSEIKIDQFGKLPQFETIGSKINNDNESESRTRERFEKAQAELNQENINDPDPNNTNPWQTDNSKKGGYKSPLTNDDKRNKVSTMQMSEAITNLLGNKEYNDSEDEDEEGKMWEATSLTNQKHSSVKTTINLHHTNV